MYSLRRIGLLLKTPYFNQHRLRQLLVLPLSLALVSCATAPGAIAPVPPPQSFTSLDCEELDEQLAKVQYRLATLYKVQQANRTRDATAVATSIIITPFVAVGVTIAFLGTLLLWPFGYLTPHGDVVPLPEEALSAIGEAASEVYPTIGRHEFTQTIARLKGAVLTLNTIRRHKLCPVPAAAKPTGSETAE